MYGRIPAYGGHNLEWFGISCCDCILYEGKFHRRLWNARNKKKKFIVIVSSTLFWIALPILPTLPVRHVIFVFSKFLLFEWQQQDGNN